MGVRKSPEYKDVFSYDIDYSNIINDNFIVQGICKSKDYFFISCYSKDKVNSRVYIYKDKFIKYVDLDNNSHVGGITYCNKGYLFITEKNGKINCYKYNDFTKEDHIKIYPYWNLYLNKSKEEILKDQEYTLINYDVDYIESERSKLANMNIDELVNFLELKSKTIHYETSYKVFFDF